jgi:hypothetical protein
MVAITGKDDSKDWPKSQYELFPDETFFQGKRTPSISVRKPGVNPRKKKPAKATPGPKVMRSLAEDLNDSIPDFDRRSDDEAA